MSNYSFIRLLNNYVRPKAFSLENALKFRNILKTEGS